MNVLALLHSFGPEDGIACYTAQVIRDSCNGKQEGPPIGTWSLYIHSDEELTNFAPILPSPKFLFATQCIKTTLPFRKTSPKIEN